MKKERKYIALRIKIAASFFLTVLLFTIVAGVIRTGMFIHSKNQDMQLGAITLEKKKTELVCGDIFDCHKRPIVTNAEKGMVSSPPVEYTYLIGGFDTVLGNTGVYCINQRTVYEKESWFSNKGKSLLLTIDDQLQRKCFALTKGTESSICVLERKSGKLRALTSTDQKYDLDLTLPISEEMQTYIENKPGFYVPNYSEAIYPGSVFKIFTTALLCENGESEFTVEDKGYLTFDNKGEVNNFESISYGLCKLDSAFVHSSNVYFAAAANEVGAQAFQNLYNKMNISNIKTDFGEVNVSLNISDSPSDFELAQLGYGQYCSMDTVSIAVMTQALIQEGKAYKPHVVAATARNNGESLEIIDEVPEEVLSDNIVNKSTSDKIISLMRSAAKNYGFKDGILSKTGTSEIVDDVEKETKDRAVMVIADDTYIVVISTIKAGMFGIDHKNKAEKIMDYLQQNKDKM